MSIDIYCAECGECMGDLSDMICEDCLAEPESTELAVERERFEAMAAVIERIFQITIIDGGSYDGADMQDEGVNIGCVQNKTITQEMIDSNQLSNTAFYSVGEDSYWLADYITDAADNHRKRQETKDV